jgi:hypothetical protein
MRYKLSFPYQDTTSPWRLEREFWCRKQFGSQRYCTYPDGSNLIFGFWYENDQLMFILRWGDDKKSQ